MKKIFTLLTLIAAIATGAKAQNEPIDLDINRIDGCIFYSNSEYSQPGAYDYFFGFSDNGSIPFMDIDIFMPTNQGISAGTYSIENGLLGDIVLILNDNEYNYAYSLGLYPHIFTEATMEVSDMGNGEWKFSFTGTTDKEEIFRFEATGTVEIKEDNTGSEPTTTYKYEPTQKSNIDITWTEADVYTDYVAEHGLIDIFFDSEQTDANGRNYEGETYFFTSDYKIPAGTYPISFACTPGTFQASAGCSTTSNSLDYPTFIRTYTTANVFDSWYIVSGYITVGYDTNDQMYLFGHGKSYNGSDITFRYGTLPEGITPAAMEIKNLQPRKEFVGRRVMVTDGQHRFDLQGRAN